MAQSLRRKPWLDWLRGFAMLLVIWGHVAKTEHLFFVITGPFKMPLFFAITGYVFNGKSTKHFFENLWLKIIVPWIILSLVWIKPVFAVLTRHPENIPVYLYDFVSGKILWFMPCIIIAECIHFFIRKCIKKNYVQYAALLTISLLGFVMNGYGIGRFAMFNVACVSQIFMLFGYWFRNNESKLRITIDNRKLFVLVCIYVCLVLLSIMYYPGMAVDVHNNIYYNYLICGTMTFISLLFFLIVSERMNLQVNKLFRWIIFVGQNTLVFYIMHYYPRFVINRLLLITKLSIDDLIGYFFVFILICLIMSITALIVNKWFPFAVGKSRFPKINPD